MHPARNRAGAWIIAWALALALNTGAIVGLRSLASPRSSETIHRPEPVRLVFKSSGLENRRSEEPRFFTELPPDREDVAPKQPDFLSNVTSRARDPIPGGDAALPRMQGESDVPTVKLEPDGTPSRPSPAPEPAPQATEPAAPRAAESQEGGGSRAPEQTRNASSGLASPAPAKPDAARPGGDGASTGSKGSDIAQPEMANPEGNAALTGDVSLNTTAWDYAPWLQRFGRQLMARWFAPPAYTLGILKEGGWALVEIEISPAGKVLRQELLEEQGHPSLSLAAQSALRSMAPIEPLPANFPEPTLILRIRMIYPRIRPR